ncbi:MAG: hypothetical protein PVG71_07970 [Anaerolineae bacterium]
MDAQLDRPEAHLAQPEYLLGTLLGQVDLPRRGVHVCAFGALAAQQGPDGPALDVTADVPEGGLHPVVTPAEVAHLAQSLADGRDVGRIEANEVGADQAAQSLALALEGHACGQPPHAVVGREPKQGEALFRSVGSRRSTPDGRP